VTTVMLGSCSLSTVHVDGVDAGDIFGRVEAIPREHVISAVDDHKTWTNAEEYIQALEARPAADVKANPYASWGMGPAARLILRIGDRADLVVIDPERLDAKLDDYAEDRVEQYGGLSRMVNRNDDTVNAVFVRRPRGVRRRQGNRSRRRATHRALPACRAQGSGTVRSRDGVRKWQLRIRSWGCGRRCRPGTGTR